jgi:hypothetical protein
LFFEFPVYDECSVLELEELEPLVLRDAAASHLVVLALGPTTTLAQAAPILHRWQRLVPVQVLQTVTFLPTF